MGMRFRSLTLVVLSLALAATGATAQSFGPPGPPTYQRQIETRGPARGHSGFVRFGSRQLYCDYIRVPNRSCNVDRAGRERCQIRSWTLQQRCY